MVTTRIAIATDDGHTISQHFGRARSYVVLTLENEQVVKRESRDKLGHLDFAGPEDQGHHHGAGTHETHRHGMMFAPITDCEACVVGGMGIGAYDHLRSMGIRPIVTDFRSIDEAAQALIEGKLVNHEERVHG
ncbi:MAG TPA: NifB/NifX family molybdenum-iron cluster-binding protein [Terriglobales bacterium]|nr:NifB/NifX family molybdenum-iron cluster-binding protein [Terriglobales bacterium]